MTPDSSAGTGLQTLIRAWYHREPEWSPAVADWDGFWALVRRHGLDGMAGALAAQGTPFPEPLRERAVQSYFSNALRYRRAEALCGKVCGAAREANVRLSVVKGPALSAAYGDDGIRGFGDVDILVPDAVAAFRLSDACGLERRHGYIETPAVFWKRARNIGRIEAADSHVTVEFTHGVDAANQPLHDLYKQWPDCYLLEADAAHPFPVPVDHAHLLFLLQHLSLHWCNRLVWLADFAVIMRSGKYDAGWLEEAAGRLEMRKLLHSVTAFCKDKIDSNLPVLCCGQAGWKDGLFLAMVSDEALTGAALFKYGGGRWAEWIKDPVLGALQHVCATDMSHPTFDRNRRASQWTRDWLQFVLLPGGNAFSYLTVLITPFLFVVMLALVCAVFRRTPRGFLRLAVAGDSACTGRPGL